MFPHKWCILPIDLKHGTSLVSRMPADEMHFIHAKAEPLSALVHFLPFPLEILPYAVYVYNMS